MKKLIVAALLVVGMTTFAQEKNTKSLVKASEKINVKQSGEEELKKISEELKLSDVQYKQLAGVMADYSAKRQAAADERKASIANNTKITAEEFNRRKEDKKADIQAYKEKVKNILTAEQYAQWEQINQQKKSKIKAE